MTPFDRQVRAQIYRHIVAAGSGPSPQNLAEQRGWDPEEVAEALVRLQERNFIAMNPDASRVMMAHPFSGVETPFRSQVGDRSWFANCAWDALAILALMGDGAARQSIAGNEMGWRVSGGVVSPNGVIHVAVPTSRFWDDIVFT